MVLLDEESVFEVCFCQVLINIDDVVHFDEFGDIAHPEQVTQLCILNLSFVLNNSVILAIADGLVLGKTEPTVPHELAQREVHVQWAVWGYLTHQFLAEGADKRPLIVAHDLLEIVLDELGFKVRYVEPAIVIGAKLIQHIQQNFVLMTASDELVSQSAG